MLKLISCGTRPMQAFACSSARSMLWPKTATSPPDFVTSEVTMPMTVVLPAPFGPRNAKKSPSATSRVMPLGAVRMFEFSLLVIFLFGFWLLPRLLAHRPTTYWRIPNRDYWLAPERRGQTIEALHGLISWMGVVVLLLFMAVTQLVFDANLRTPPHLASDALIWLLLSFVLFIVMWIWVIVRQFGRVP